MVVKVHYAGLNPADRYLAERQYPARPALPHILGRDGMGSVVEVGAGGERVVKGGGEAGDVAGGYGDQSAGDVRRARVVVPADWLGGGAGGVERRGGRGGRRRFI